VKDAVLDSEQEAAGYDDGEFHAATDLMFLTSLLVL